MMGGDAIWRQHGDDIAHLHDRGDREVPFEHGAALARSWPGTRFVPLDGLGHGRVLRDPDVVQLVTSFAPSRDDGANALRPLRAA